MPTKCNAVQIVLSTKLLLNIMSAKIVIAITFILHVFASTFVLYVNGYAMWCATDTSIRSTGPYCTCSNCAYGYCISITEQEALGLVPSFSSWNISVSSTTLHPGYRCLICPSTPPVVLVGSYYNCDTEKQAPCNSGTSSYPNDTIHWLSGAVNVYDPDACTYYWKRPPGAWNDPTSGMHS